MNEHIGTIINGVAVMLMINLITWGYDLKHRRRKRMIVSQKKMASQDKIYSQDKTDDVISKIRHFLDSQELKYEQCTEKDSIESFTVGFEGQNGEISMRVYVMPDQDMYQIIGQQKTFIPESDREAAFRAINRYNMCSNNVAGCISNDGAITFWIGRYADAETFSEVIFEIEFCNVLHEAEYTTHILLKESKAST